MMNVKITKRITIGLTAEDWSLYGEDGESARDVAAFEMNRHIENILNDQPTKAQAARDIAEILKKYSKFGADDSEGHYVASDLMDEFF